MPRVSLASFRSFAAPFLLLVIVAGFFWKLVLSDQYTWLEGGDTASQTLPWMQYQAGEWHQWRLPLWSPYEYGGQPTIGQGVTTAANPLNWIFYSLPLRHGWLRESYLHWYFVLIHFLGALFAYWLLRDLKRSRLASIAGGCAFGLGGYIGTTDWPCMLMGAIWAPLVFLFLLRAVRGERPTASALFSGFFLGMAWLSGHHQIPVFISLTATATWLYYILRPGRPDWKAARLAGVFALFVFLTAALQILPAYEYGKRVFRWVSAPNPVGWNNPVPYIVHQHYSLSPTALLGILFPNILRNADPFIGVTITALALLALAMRWREPMVRLFGLISLGGLFFSLAPNDVLHGVLYSVVPFVEKARNPSMAILIFHFGIVVLAAYGIDSLFSSIRSPWPCRVALALCVLGAAVFLLNYGILLTSRLQSPADDRDVLTGFLAVLVAGLIYGISRGNLRPVAGGVFLLLLILIELGNETGYWMPATLEQNRNTFLRPMSQNADIVAFLRGRPWPVRVEVKSEDIPFNIGDWYGMDTWGYFGASLPTNLIRLNPQTERARILFGVNYSIGKKPDMQGQQEVFVGQSGLKVYMNTKAMPRTWSVHEALHATGDQQARSLLSDPSFDLWEKTFLLESPPKLEVCSGRDNITLLRRLPNQLTIRAAMGCKGLVILGDSFFPGWRATVDGAPARIYEAYAGIRGVVVGKGRHTIEMRYRPWSVLAGAVLTASALLTALGAALLPGIGGPEKE